MYVVSKSQPSIEKNLSAAGVPPRLLHCSRETWEGEWLFGEQLDIALLHGPVGSGKSHLAVALCLEAIRSGMQPGVRKEHSYSPNSGGKTWWVGGALFRDIQDSMEALKPGHDDAEDTLDILKSCRFLAFDDLGAERLTDWTLDRVSLIMRHRYNHMLPTVVTTNLSPSELNNTDPRLASRLCSGLIHKCTGRDRRIG